MLYRVQNYNIFCLYLLFLEYMCTMKIMLLLWVCINLRKKEQEFLN